jgi:N-acetylneuraminic acid mutarotase
MSRTTKAATLLGLCTILAACDEASTPDSTAPRPVPASEAEVSSLVDRWAAKRSLSPNRNWQVAAAVNGRIYVAGGEHVNWHTMRAFVLSRFDVYDVAANSWSQLASLPSSRMATNGASVIDGKIYVTGGWNSQRLPTKTMFVYSLSSRTWSRKADLPRAGCRGVQGVIAKKLYVYLPSAPTCDESSAGAARLFRYDPTTNAWATRAAPPASIGVGAGGVISGKLYIAGQDGRLQVYDPSSNAWTTRAAMPQVWRIPTAAVLNGKLYLVGGEQPGAECSGPKLQVYDPATNRWASKTPPPVGTQLGAAAGAAGKVYYITGTMYEGCVQLIPDFSPVYAYTP